MLNLPAWVAQRSDEGIHPRQSTHSAVTAGQALPQAEYPTHTFRHIILIARVSRLVTKEAVAPPPSTDVKAETPRGLTAHPDPHDFRLTAPACARGPVNHLAVSHWLPTIYCGVLVNFTFRKYERSAHWCLMTSLRYHLKKTFFFFTWNRRLSLNI